ncbi:short-chain collagen C4-like [Mytilus trossulus]|uniref:short-chain collagen C4-like n=1 Tax=Mytilus trossulus TaxID=6551 RepID=UPI003004857B
MDRNFVLCSTIVCCVVLMVAVLPSVADECSGDSCRNVISMPLVDDMKATLKADLDVTNMNNHLKAYIEQEIQKGFEAAMNDVMRQLIDKKLEMVNATIEATMHEEIYNKLAMVNATVEATMHEELTRFGVTYIRWGRKGCPDGAELVYTGQAGGNKYNNEGGGVNNLCLPNDPENGEHQLYDNSQVHGAEYYINSDRKPHGMSDNLRYKEVPCVVCYRKQRSSILIVPGRKTCYKDWNVEYEGYLMANHYIQKRTNYACIDVNAEPFDSRSSHESNSVLFYPIRTSCGSLRCPPYTEAADVYCVVCTK